MFMIYLVLGKYSTNGIFLKQLNREFMYYFLIFRIFLVSAVIFYLRFLKNCCKIIYSRELSLAEAFFKKCFILLKEDLVFL